MFDLKDTFNLIYLVILGVANVVFLFVNIDFLFAKEIKRSARTAIFAISPVTIFLCLVLAVLGGGLIFGFTELAGGNAVVFGITLPGFAKIAAMSSYALSLSLIGFLFVQSLVALICAAVKKPKILTEPNKITLESSVIGAESKDSPENAGSNQALEKSAPLPVSNMKGLMDEITGLVDRLDSDGEIFQNAQDSPSAEENGLDEDAENLFDGLRDHGQDLDKLIDENLSDLKAYADMIENFEPSLDEDEYIFDVAAPAENKRSFIDSGEMFGALESDGEPNGDAMRKDMDAAFEATAYEEMFVEKTAVEEMVGEPYSRRPTVSQSAYEVDDYIEQTEETRHKDRIITPVALGGVYPAPKLRTIVRNPVSFKNTEESVLIKAEETKKADAKSKSEKNGKKSGEKAVSSLSSDSVQLKEAEFVDGGLPVTKRHVIMNRTNVVNMFSNYLNSKKDREKEKLENSLNTIIIK